MARINISSEATLEDLTVQYCNEYYRVHNAKPQWTPPVLTKEWLVDQLKALDWYLPYDTSSARPVEENTLYKKVSKKKVKEENPFK
jgi:hypothetical protein